MKKTLFLIASFVLVLASPLHATDGARGDKTFPLMMMDVQSIPVFLAQNALHGQAGRSTASPSSTQNAQKDSVFQGSTLQETLGVNQIVFFLIVAAVFLFSGVLL